MNDDWLLAVVIVFGIAIFLNVLWKLMPRRNKRGGTSDSGGSGDSGGLFGTSDGDAGGDGGGD